MDKILNKAYEEGKLHVHEGELPTYQPQLAKANIENVGIYLIDKDKNHFKVGDVETKFTAQSIIKVLLYQIALENYSLEELNKYVGVKGSSKAYNSIADLELSEGKKPVNPFINSGALVVTYLLIKKFKDDAFNVVLEKAKSLINRDDLNYDQEFIDTGKPVAFRNLAIINTLKSNNTIGNDVSTEEILDLYFKACCLLVNAKDLANYSFVLSNNGQNSNGKCIIEKSHVKIIKAVMATAGMYDYSGDFAVRVGLPAKSGVGGGILTATNQNIGLATYSPGLDSQGNSLVGIKILEILSKELNLSIY